MERIEDLQFLGLRIIQDSELACFSEDAVLLANFIKAAPSDRVMDLGAGNGVISILAQGKTGAHFTGVEKQKPLVDLAKRSAALNKQEIRFYEMDVQDAPDFFGHGSFSVVAANPPYYHEGARAKNASRSLARHGDTEVLDRFLLAAFLLLKNRGRLYICWPAEALADVICALRNKRLEPKRMTIVRQHFTLGLVLIEAVKLGGSGLTLELMDP